MYYIIFSSITYATWIKRSFMGDGSTISIMHSPKAIAQKGCTYSLVVDLKKAAEIVQRAKELGVRILGVYEQSTDGEFVSVNL